jgi:hypothetical protein
VRAPRVEANEATAPTTNEAENIRLSIVMVLSPTQGLWKISYNVTPTHLVRKWLVPKKLEFSGRSAIAA